jgi:hypothetical protein
MSHRVEPDDGQQDNSNEVSTPSQPKSRGLFYCGIGILVVVPLNGIIFFAVGLSRFNSANSSFPNLEFASPPSTVIAFHWTFVITFASLGVLLLAQPYMSEGWLALSFIVCVVASLAFYSCYLVFYFMSPEFMATSNSWSVTTYESITQQMVQGQPYASFEGRASKSLRKCSLNSPKKVSAMNAIDASVIPNITQSIEANGIVLVKQELTVNWACGQNEIIDAWKNKIAECLMADYTSKNIHATNMIDGYVEVIFVSRDGELPGYLERGIAVAAGIFAAGILHCYTVNAFPLAIVKVVKNEALVGETPSCSQWPGGHCGRKAVIRT